jgi:Rrf2 family iron-sulfur cluster assembly transcriptional regulator
MIINQTAEYALRAAAILASRPEGELLSATEIARLTGVPLAYLSKLLRKLVLAELLYAQKGNSGGFRLARAPEQIRFAEILEAVGCDVGEGHCAFGFPRCNPANPCPLHPAWKSIQESSQAWAHQHTLRDVIAADSFAPPTS